MLVWAVSSVLLVGVEVLLSISLQDLVAGLNLEAPNKERLLSFGFVSTIVSLVIGRALLSFVNLFCNEGMREKAALYLRGYWVRAALLTELDTIELSHLNNQLNETIHRAGAYMASLMQLAFQSFSAILYTSACLYYSPKLFFLALLLLVLAGILTRIVATRSTIVGNKRLALIQSMNAYLLRAKQNHKYLKLLRIEKFEIEKIEETLVGYYRYSLKAIAYFCTSNISPHTLGYITVILVLLLSISRGYTENVVVFVYILLRFSQNLAGSAAAISNMKSLESSFNEACNFRDFQTSESTEAFPDMPIQSLELKITSLEHPGQKDQFLLKNVQIRLDSGESIAIVGPSGCGKSTLIDCILQLYPHLDGKNLINGKTWTLDQYCDRIAYVSSNPYLIKGSIRENLAYGNHQTSLLTEGWLMQVLDASLLDLVSQVKELDSILLTESGQGLSTGQKQRLSIARALARKPDLLVLDEATSNLDTFTEDKLWGRIKALLPEVIIVLATHRPKFAGNATYLLDFHSTPAEVRSPTGSHYES